LRKKGIGRISFLTNSKIKGMEAARGGTDEEALGLEIRKAVKGWCLCWALDLRLLDEELGERHR
jgi:hypothetical protein